MLRSSEVKGMPVLTEAGEAVDVVQEPIFDPVSKSVLGFLIDEGGWSGSARVLPWTDVLRIDQNADAVIIQSQENIVSVTQTDAIRSVLESGHRLIGLDVYKPNRNKVGTVTDLFFDTETGKIGTFIVSPATPLGIPIKQLVVQAKTLTSVQIEIGKVLLSSAAAQKHLLNDDRSASILEAE